MNCQKIRTVIETGAHHEPRGEAVRQHLTACADCRGWAEETESLFSLLQDVPRVQAPADFDLRLRARLAVAREDRRGLRSQLAAFWSRTFTWSQAAPALAAIAIVTTFTLLYVVRYREPAPVSEQVALVKPTASTPTAAPPRVETPAPPSISEEAVNPAPPKMAVKGSGVRPLMIKAPAPESSMPAEEGGTPILLGAREGRPVMTITQVTYGAQRAVSHRAAGRPATAGQPADRPVETIF